MENIEIRKEEKQNEKGYRLIIENLDTGEQEVNIETRAIIGAAQCTAEQGADGDGYSTHGFVVTSCNTMTLIATIMGAEKAVETIKNDLIKKNPLLALYALSKLAGGGRQLRGTTYERNIRAHLHNVNRRASLCI